VPGNDQWQKRSFPLPYGFIYRMPRVDSTAEHVRQRRVGRVAERPVYLDGPVDDPVQAVGHEVLGHRHLGLEVISVVDLVGGVQHHQLRLVELHCGVGDHPLDALLLGQQRTVAEPVQGTLHHHVQGRLGLGDPAHAVGQAGRPQPVLAQQVPLAPAAQHLVVVQPQVLYEDLRVSGRAVHRLDLAHLDPPVRRDVHQERRVGGLGDLRVLLGTAYQDGERYYDFYPRVPLWNIPISQ